MGCERPDGIAANLARDEGLLPGTGQVASRFHPSWEGDLPLPDDEEVLDLLVATNAAALGISGEEVDRLRDYLHRYEQVVFEDPETGLCYHRACGGGAVVQGELGAYCVRCGRFQI